MSLVKRTYVDQETVITAENLNAIQDAIIENEEAIEDQGEAIEGKYSKPAGGIPATDMASGVQTSLGKADSAYQKPSGGIPASDMASGVQTSLGKADTALQSSDIDNTLSVTGKAADAKKTGDEISDVKNTLSHKADVIYDTASGDIASFPDGADGLPVKDLTVGIEPVQSGSGDPSPENVRPISGWTGCNVTRTGKNLVSKISDGRTNNSVTYTPNQSGGIQVSCSSTSHSKSYSTTSKLAKTFILDPGTYTLSANIQSTATSLYVAFSPTGRSGFVTSTTASQVFTLAEKTEVYIAISVEANGVSDETIYPMLEFGSTASPYEPFGQVYPITFPSGTTVYGGTLDVTSGVLTVDRAKLTFNGSENWGIAQGDVFYLDSALPSGYARNALGDWFCNKYAVVNGVLNTSEMHDSRPDDSITNQPGQPTSRRYDRILIRDSTYATVEDFKASLAQTNLEIVFTVPSSTAYTLPTTEVTTLLGQNNVWSDTGAVLNCEYPCDTKLYIQKINTPTDDDMIADANIASGKYFIVNNNLYLSTTTILAGDPIKPGTNCTLTNLAAALNALNS